LRRGRSAGPQRRGDRDGDDGGPRRPDLAGRRDVPWREAKTHVLTHTLTMAWGVRGRARLSDRPRHAIFRLQEHTDRLLRSAHILGMPVPYDRHAINEAQPPRCAENGLPRTYIRPMCFYGSRAWACAADNSCWSRHGRAWDGRVLGEENIEARHPREGPPSTRPTSTSPCAAPRRTATT